MILAALVQIASSTLIAYVFACVFGLQTWVSLLNLLGGFALARLVYKRGQAGIEDLSWFSFSKGVAGWIERALLVFIGYASFRHFTWLIYPVGGDLKTLSPNNYGDLPLHFNYIRMFANGLRFPPLNPEFPTEPLRYPLGIDLYDALWEKIGVPTASHLFLVGMFGFCASFVALRKWGGWLAIGGLFLNGGLIGWDFLGQKFPAEVENSLGWKNIFLTVFITQRGMLFAIPVGILLLIYLQRLIGSEDENQTTNHVDTKNKFQIAVFGGLWGSLALFHLHTFFAVSLLLAGFAVIAKRNGIAAFIRLVIPALPLGVFFTLHSTGFLKKASVLHWEWGWMAGSEGFWRFSILNFGIWIPFLFALPLLIWFAQGQSKAERNRLSLMWLLAAVLLALFFNLMFASWAWDNIKVLIWPYLLLLAVGDRVMARYFSTGIYELLTVVVAALLLVPGVTSVAKTLGPTKNALTIYTLSDLARTEGALKNIPADAVIAAATSHNHALTWFGRLRAVGYDGHLWSHGIEYGAQMDDLKVLMQGQPEWKQAAKRLHANYLFWGPAEVQAFGSIPLQLKNELKNVSPVSGYEVYALPNP